MSQTIIAKGIEKFFIESWEEWDDIDYLVTQFYRCKLRDDLNVDLDKSKMYNVCIDLEKNLIDIFDIVGDEVTEVAILEVESITTKLVEKSE